MTAIETRTAMLRRHKAETLLQIERAICQANGNARSAAEIIGWSRNAMDSFYKRAKGLTPTEWLAKRTTPTHGETT